MTQAELQAAHGTPQEFEAAVWRAYGSLDITMDEAQAGILKYRQEWAEAANQRGAHMSTVTDFDSDAWNAVHKATELGLLPKGVTAEENLKHGRQMHELRQFIIDEYTARAKRAADLSRGVAALHLATLFHDTYERLAPAYGYETRPETRQFNADSPNGKLMIAVCGVILEERSKGA